MKPPKGWEKVIVGYVITKHPVYVIRRITKPKSKARKK